MTGSAITPNEIPKISAAAASGSPARAPWEYRAIQRYAYAHLVMG